MLKHTLSTLLVSVAGQYAELSPSDVGIGINGGRLVVEDVKLRVDKLNNAALPFEIHSGRAGRLRINVPWSALSNSPVTVYLENVHLSASAKHPTQSFALSSSSSAHHFHWHETRLGRVLFNVAVELHGLKLEYADTSCRAVLSLASLRAHTADASWSPSFAPLDARGAVGAAAMRKAVQLRGLHCIMRSNSSDEEQQDAFETRAPILDGLAATLKLLLCAGGRESNAMHAELDVELEEPAVSLSARQLQWLARIWKHGVGDTRASTTELDELAHTPRRPRPSSPVQSTPSPPSSPRTPLVEKELLHAETLNSSSLEEKARASIIENQARVNRAESEDGTEWYSDSDDGDSDGTVSIQDDSAQQHRPGALRSIWEAIIGENGDETVYDAAFALGLQSAREVKSEEADNDSTSELISEQVSKSHGQSQANGAATVQQTDIDMEDLAYALRAVAAAAEAGGFTFRVRLRTPDPAAVDRVILLERELMEMHVETNRLRDVHKDLEHAQHRAEEMEREMNALREKNAALVRELADLEQMAAVASKNKDDVIREVEGALTKAERNLQVLLEEKMTAQRETRSPEQGSGSENEGREGHLHRSATFEVIEYSDYESGNSEQGGGEGEVAAATSTPAKASEGFENVGNTNGDMGLDQKLLKVENVNVAGEQEWDKMERRHVAEQMMEEIALENVQRNGQIPALASVEANGVPEEQVVAFEQPPPLDLRDGRRLTYIEGQRGKADLGNTTRVKQEKSRVVDTLFEESYSSEGLTLI